LGGVAVVLAGVAAWSFLRSSPRAEPSITKLDLNRIHWLRVPMQRDFNSSCSAHQSDCLSLAFTAPALGQLLLRHDRIIDLEALVLEYRREKAGVEKIDENVAVDRCRLAGRRGNASATRRPGAALTVARASAHSLQAAHVVNAIQAPTPGRRQLDSWPG